MPADVAWRGKTVHTGIWKSPVEGPVRVRRLNLDGDGQGDLAGHGGEQRAVLVYQTESYDYWARFFGRKDLRPGHFGENFTVTGLGDDEVCIGDRYQIGDAEFEVTQPRVTCFRVGMRLGVPDMPNLLVAHHRPGFYCRVINEGRVCAGDDIVRIRRGRHELSVAEIDALLYLPNRDVNRLRKAVDVPALSPGWQASFTELLAAQEDSAEAGWSGFRAMRVAATRRETAAVLSIELEAGDRTPVPASRPGQYLTVRVPAAGDPAPVRSYSLSGAVAVPARYRISVKREQCGLVSRWLHANAKPGMDIDVAAPRGDFWLLDTRSPVLLVSAGIGVTPVLAMLHALAGQRTDRDIWWLHTTRDADSHAFAAEVDALIAGLANVHRHVVYTASGERLDRGYIEALGLPPEAEAYLCGPGGFMADMQEALTAAGVGAARIHTEIFGSLPAINPGVVARSVPPHLPAGSPGTGPTVGFARSGITVNWSPRYDSLLELAEACDVPTRYSCRSGVCHVCLSQRIAGVIDYSRTPLELPPGDGVLICSAVPGSDLILDL
jgi:ferredoxin-NADP reductase/MOSC domain-containing protein YiiM